MDLDTSNPPSRTPGTLASTSKLGARTADDHHDGKCASEPPQSLYFTTTLCSDGATVNGSSSRQHNFEQVHSRPAASRRFVSQERIGPPSRPGVYDRVVPSGRRGLAVDARQIRPRHGHLSIPRLLSRGYDASFEMKVKLIQLAIDVEESVAVDAIAAASRQAGAVVRVNLSSNRLRFIEGKGDAPSTLRRARVGDPEFVAVGDGGEAELRTRSIRRKRRWWIAGFISIRSVITEGSIDARTRSLFRVEVAIARPCRVCALGVEVGMGGLRFGHLGATTARPHDTHHDPIRLPVHKKFILPHRHP